MSKNNIFIPEVTPDELFPTHNLEKLFDDPDSIDSIDMEQLQKLLYKKWRKEKQKAVLNRIFSYIRNNALSLIAILIAVVSLIVQILQ